MSERENLAAYTPCVSPFPPYLSINRVRHDGSIEVTVRSPAKPDGSCGDSAVIVIPRGDFRIQVLGPLMGRIFHGEDD